MKQILVIDSAELWITLNREFAGRNDLRISETPSWDSGMRLAEVEWIDLIVCHCEGTTAPPEQFTTTTAEERTEPTRVICVGRHDAPVVACRNPRYEISVCTPDQLLDAVRSAISPKGEDTDTIEVDLLAHCQIPGSQPGESRSIIVNLMKFDSGSIVFESSGTLEVGTVISMRFVTPRVTSPNGGSDRARVDLDCAVRTCLNPEKFLYRGEITRIGTDHAEAMKSFLTARASKMES